MKKVLIFLLLVVTAYSQSFEMNGHKVDRTVTKSAVDKNDLSKLNYTVYDINGNSQVSFNIDWSYDIPYPQPGVLEDGSIVLVSSFDAVVKIYNRFGQFEREFSLLKEAEPDYERTIYFDLKTDRFVFAISDPKLTNTVVKLVDSKGAAIDEYLSEYKNASGIKISGDGNLIALSAFGWKDAGPEFKTSVFNNNFEEIISINQPFEKAGFVDAGNLFCGWTNRNYFLIDLNNRFVLVDESADEGKIILDLFADSHDLFAVVSNSPYLNNSEWYYRNVVVSRYSRNSKFTEATINTSEFSDYSIQKSNNKVELQVGSQIIELK